MTTTFPAVYLVLQTMNSGDNKILAGVSYKVLEPKLENEASGTTNKQGIHVFDKSMKVFKEGMKVKIEAELQGYNKETFEYTLSNARDQLFLIVMTKDLVCIMKPIFFLTIVRFLDEQ